MRQKVVELAGDAATGPRHVGSPLTPVDLIKAFAGKVRQKYNYFRQRHQGLLAIYMIKPPLKRWQVTQAFADNCTGLTIKAALSPAS